MMKNKSHQNKFLRIITTPLRALAKARDFYVKSMNNYADKVYYGSTGFGGVSYADPLPRSFSTNLARSHENDDFKELMRVASTSSLGNRVDLGSVVSINKSASTSSRLETRLNQMVKPEKGTSSSSTTLLLQQQKEKMGGPFNKGVPRSASVGMAKIEEDKPCEFDDDNGLRHHYGGGVDKKGVSSSSKHKISKLFPRSRSYGVGGSKRNPYAATL